MFGRKQKNEKLWRLLDESPYRKSYHRHFEGYYEYAVEDKKGKKKIKRVYMGTYYTPQMSDSQRRAHIFLYWLFWSAAAALCVFSIVVKIPANMSRLMAVFQLLLGFGFIWLGLGLVNYSFSEKMMTAAIKKLSVDDILFSSMICIFLSLLSAVAVLTFSMITKTLSVYCLYTIVGYLASAVVLFFLRKTEKGVVYVETQSVDTVPDDAVEL